MALDLRTRRSSGRSHILCKHGVCHSRPPARLAVLVVPGTVRAEGAAPCRNARKFEGHPQTCQAPRGASQFPVTTGRPPGCSCGWVPVPAECCQHCCRARRQQPSDADSRGSSIQYTTDAGRSWMACPFLRIRCSPK